MSAAGRTRLPSARRIDVRRTARFFQLGRVEEGIRQVWIVCHGYRQSADRFARRFAAARDEGAVVVAPEALSRFYVDPAPGAHGPESRVGASWMTRVDREAEIRDYVRYLDALARLILPGGPDPGTAGEPLPGEPDRPAGAGGGERMHGAPVRPRVVALGFSQGGHAAARWAAFGATRVDDLVLWGSYLPPDRGIAVRLARVRITTVFGDRDPVADAASEEEQKTRLEAAGAACAQLAFPGRHEIDEGVVRDLARRFAV